MVELLESFGNDLTVVNAARVSFAKESTEFSAQDEKLINYLAKHHHNSPFFHPQVRFRLKMPIFVAREWFRHTVGFARNEVSRRYVSDKPECWIPTEDDLRKRDPNIKQGSSSELINHPYLYHAKIRDNIRDSIDLYEELIKEGLAPEVARCVLPQGMYTEFIETASLAAYARLCNLRLDPSAQKEIRQYATLVGEHMEKIFPISWKALTST
jgi:thymidylate synthase (FAD)